MHILMVSPVNEDAPGGIASHVSTLRKALNRIGVTSELLTLDVSPQMGMLFYVNAGLRKGLNRLHEPWGFVFSDKQAAWRLRKRLRDMTSLDLIHCHLQYADLVRKIAAMVEVPIVLTVHGYIANEALSRKTVREGSIGHRYLMSKERRIYGAADRIICVDSRLADHVSHTVGCNREVDVISNSVDTDLFRPFEDNAWDKNMVLCPRMLNPKNGVHVAIQSIELLKNTYAQTLRLVIAGDGRERESLKRYVHEHQLNDVVTFLGNVPHSDIPDLVRRAAVVVIPSIPSEGVEEATSIAALEAMASGVPVVASRIGGLREIIIEDETGYLVPPSNPNELALAVLRALERRSYLAEHAVRHVRENFGLDALGRKVLNVYQLAKRDRQKAAYRTPGLR